MCDSVIYKFIDYSGTFVVLRPQRYNLYFPLADKDGKLLSCIAGNLAGDIKSDNEHFLTPPATILDLKNNMLCRREFFLQIDNRYFRLSSGNESSILEGGLLYHKLTKRIGGLNAEIINFVPYNLGVEIMWVKLINKGKRPINIIPTSFIPLYGRSEKNLRDHRHVTSLLNRVNLSKYGIILKPTMVFNESGHALNKMNYFVLGFQDKTVALEGQFPSIEYFCGQGDLEFPDAIYKDTKAVKSHNSVFDGKEACAAFRFKNRKLKPGEETNYILIMGMNENRKNIENIFNRLNTSSKVEGAFSKTKDYWQRNLENPKFDFKDRDFNNWLFWVKLQPTLRKLFGCSFLPHFDYGKGGRGWRDLWQDALSLFISEEQKAELAIVNNFKGVRLDGSNATIITKDGDFVADRNRISRVWMDHGIWPYLTLRLYINRTGDLDILLKDTLYFCDHQLKRAKEIDKAFRQKDYLLRTAKGRIYKGNILEHLLVQALVQFFNVGKHNIIRLESADWNDGLDMAKDQGESVTFSFMYAHNLADLCVFLEALKKKNERVELLSELLLFLDSINRPVNYANYKEKQKRLELYLEKSKQISGKKVYLKIDDLINDLKKKALHISNWLKKKEWLKKEGFFNGYYDNKGRRVEGTKGKRVRMMLPAQVFAIMSGVADNNQIRKTWVSIKRYLKDRKLGGFRLNTDFAIDSYLELGRAFGFSYGDKENGAFFNHMDVMLSYALYSRGFVKEGCEVLNSIYTMSSAQEARVYPSLPEYFNSQGIGLYHYLTGSASWYIYTLMEQVLGIRFALGDIILEPKLSAGNFFKNNLIKFEFILANKKIIVEYRRRVFRKVYPVKDISVNNRKLVPSVPGFVIRQKTLQNKVNYIKVDLG